ncbi:MAG TPA: hypothetical protein DDW76_37090 [Cyanobacteria bacterium UBA11369]|nr:hypothetical protein [Cyanobacteria bacterium UBA11371]HBE54222.1 hypothetical protein [Cyanobacteria bacterium UBA11369]
MCVWQLVAPVVRRGGASSNSFPALTWERDREILEVLPPLVQDVRLATSRGTASKIARTSQNFTLAVPRRAKP